MSLVIKHCSEIKMLRSTTGIYNSVSIYVYWYTNVLVLIDTRQSTQFIIKIQYHGCSADTS